MINIILILILIAIAVYFAFFNNSDFDYFIVDLERQKLELFWKDENDDRYGSIPRLRSSCKHKGKELIFAINSGMFSEDEVPLGLHKEKDETLVPINLDASTGDFYLKPNGVFYIEKCMGNIINSVHFNTSKKVEFAMQSGPMLVENGELNPKLDDLSSKNRVVRSGVGILSATKVVFAISRGRTTFLRFAEFFRDNMHCQNALYLDGSSSNMYIKGKKEDNSVDAESNLAGIFGVTQTRRN